MNTKKKGLTSFLSTLHGGGEESRTPVQKFIRTGVSERRHFFAFPSADVKCQTSVFSSSEAVTAAGAHRRSRSPLKMTPLPDRGASGSDEQPKLGC